MAKKTAERPADGKTVGGRTIAAWKQQAGFPHGSDEQIADRVNQLAKETGYAYQCTPATVAKWRNTAGGKTLPKATRSRPEATPTPRDSQGEEGEALGTLRTLVKLLGKDAVKRLVDGL